MQHFLNKQCCTIFSAVDIVSCLLYVLLKALPPLCMKYTAQGESQVANIAEAKPSAIFATRLSSRAV